MTETHKQQMTEEEYQATLTEEERAARREWLASPYFTEPVECPACGQETTAATLEAVVADREARAHEEARRAYEERARIRERAVELLRGAVAEGRFRDLGDLGEDYFDHFGDSPF